MSVATSAEKKENLLSRIFKKLSHLPRLPLIIGLSLILLVFITSITLVFLKGKNFKSTHSISGVIQKGPFISGSKVTIQELDDSLNPSGKVYEVTTDNDFGNYHFKNKISTNYAEIITQGFYFNENTSNLSSAPLTLRAIADLNSREVININVLTTLEFNRIKYLVNKESKTFSTAKNQAEEEILKLFNINLNTPVDFSSMDISKEGENNAVLLAISSILQGNKTVAELSEQLSKINLDIESDGAIDEISQINELEKSAKNLQVNIIQQNLSKRYKSLGKTVTIPSFEQYIKKLVSFRITLVNPKNNSLDADKTSKITVKFSKEINPTTIEDSVIIVNQDQKNIEGIIEYDHINWVLTFIPKDSLILSPSNKSKPPLTYQITVLPKIKSIDGEELHENFVWNFTTKRLEPLTITSINPAGEKSDADPAEKITLTFNKPINKNTFNQSTFIYTKNGNVVEGALDYIPGQIYLNFIPNEKMTYSPSKLSESLTQYSLKVSSDIQAEDGATLNEDYTWNITTKRLSPLSIASSSPVNLSHDFIPTQEISITFNKAINTSSINDSTFVYRKGQDVVGGTFQFNTQKTQLIFIPQEKPIYSPSDDTKPVVEYSIYIDPKIQAVDGATLDYSYNCKFSTRRLSPLSIISITPSNNDTQADPSQPITVKFNKKINQSTITDNNFYVLEGSNKVIGETKYDSNTITFTPNTQFRFSTSYSIHLTSDLVAEDSATFKEVVSNFKTLGLDITSNLLSYYPFNGNTNDHSGNNHTATPYDLTLTTETKPNTIRANHFGENQYIKIPAVKNLWEPGWTVSFWILFEDLQNEDLGGPPQYIFTYGDLNLATIQDSSENISRVKDSYYFKCSYSYYFSEEYCYASDININQVSYYDGTTYKFDRWYYVTLVYDGEGKFYINGNYAPSPYNKLKFSVEYDEDMYYLGFPMVARMQSPFIGKIDEFRLYNRALNKFEVQELYKQ